jgi:hypothetical protein
MALAMPLIDPFLEIGRLSTTPNLIFDLRQWYWGESVFFCLHAR